MEAHAVTTSGRPTTASDPYDETDWKAELDGRWQELGHKIFVVEPARPPTLPEILKECATLVVVWGLVQAKGNFTYAAWWLQTSRKVVRRSFLAWRRANPNLLPMPFSIFLKWSEINERAKR